jgi:hypothetical protein
MMTTMSKMQRQALIDHLNAGNETEHDVSRVRVSRTGDVYAMYHAHTPTARDGWIYLGSVREIVRDYHL